MVVVATVVVTVRSIVLCDACPSSGFLRAGERRKLALEQEERRGEGKASIRAGG